MAEFRHQASPACEFREHGPCVACNAFVNRRERHAHTPQADRGTGFDLMCGECFDCVAVAALPLMQAAEQLGVPPVARELRRALDAGSLMVIAQGFLFVN